MFSMSTQPPAEHLPLPVRTLTEVDWFSTWFNHPPIKALLPIPILLVIAPALWRVFRSTWRELDHEAMQYRTHLISVGESDYRPAVCLVIVAVVLTLQEYYGGRQFYNEMIYPTLLEWHSTGGAWLKLPKYNDLYAYVWWTTARVGGYVFIPVPLWKLFFPRDRLLDMGLRLSGFLRHLWIYGVLLLIVVPVMLLVAQQPDFGGYYPFYKNSSRSWFDFLAWESMYWAQFFALEFFFRGWMVTSLRKTLGSTAIFAMALPYCMIHYGKPYLEAHGAIVAGVVLGSLAAKTRSIYAGFLLHITVALGMDLLSLFKRDALPSVFWAPG